MASRRAITVAHGDGIGPEIMAATLRIMQEAGALLDIEEIEIGEKVYMRGNSAGIDPSSWESLRRTKVFLKAPITTPQGGGFKSLNVTTRKTLGLYANVRPCVSYHPFVSTKHPTMDVVIVRENEEDTYAGVEYRVSDDVYQSLKIITRPGSERIIRYAFEYARANNRKKVTCFTKDNIMKMTDGLFHKLFDELGADYPDLEKEHWIVDIGAAKMADTPEAFDVIVMPNLYGDILSDVAAQIAGSVGLAGSSNIGGSSAMFEAIHGSAPRRAGQDMANPSGLLLSAVMLLVHIEQPEIAARIHNAWLTTIERGIHTYDIFTETHSRQKVGTKAFAQAVISNLGQVPQTLKSVEYKTLDSAKLQLRPQSGTSKKKITGVDVAIQFTAGNASELAAQIGKAAAGDPLKLALISNRGMKVWPDGFAETFCVDQWSCRFMPGNGQAVTADQAASLFQKLSNGGLDVVRLDMLRTFDDVSGFTLAQGQ